MDELFDKIFGRIQKLSEEHNGKSPSELNDIIFNSDGTPNAELFGDIYEDIKEGIKQASKNYVSPNFSDISNFSDDELYDNLSYLLFGKGDLTEVQHIAYVAYEFEMECVNGGVSQYFVNTRGEHVHELSDCLEKIGVSEYARLCKEFILKYNISKEDFTEKEGEDYFELAEAMYPYEELEEALDAIDSGDSLADYIISFVRANSKDFEKNDQ